MPLVWVSFLLLAPAQAVEAEVARLEEAAQKSPSNALAWKELGSAMTARRKPELALAAFEKACELAPKDESACYYLARTLLDLGRYDQAVEPFEKALRAAPNKLLPRVHRTMALNFVALTRPEDAERHFREAIRLNHRSERPDDDPRIDYGAFLFRQGRAEEAFPLLERAVHELPDSARAHTELAKVLLSRGKPGAAATVLERAIELNPRSWSSRLLLGRAYVQLGRTEQGEQQLRLGREGWKESYGSPAVR